MTIPTSQDLTGRQALHTVLDAHDGASPIESLPDAGAIIIRQVVTHDPARPVRLVLTIGEAEVLYADLGAALGAHL